MRLETCLLNASGCHCTSKKDLDELNEQTCVGAIVSKSSTIEPRLGNPEPRLYIDNYGSINSMGLPNKGYKFYMNYISNKPFIQSIYPFSKAELNIMLQDINKTNVKFVEVNLSCPNLVSNSLTFSINEFEDYFLIISQFSNLIIGVKLPPFYELAHFKTVADLLLKYNIKFITCINSIVNGLMIDHQNKITRIIPKNGLGGIGGLYCKPTALSNVYNFYRLLQDKIPIIGCGGISSGQDVYEHLLCGAVLVQIGTELVRNGPDCFKRIWKEFNDILEKNNETIEEIRGKLN